MTGRQTERLLRRHVLPRLKGYSAQGRILHCAPVKQVLVGFDFGTSDYSKLEVVVEPLLQPLYVPTTFVWYGCVSWLDGPRRQRFTLRDLDDEPTIAAIVDYVVKHRAWLERFDSPFALAEGLAAKRRLKSDHLALEVLAYSRILAGDAVGGTRAIERLQEISRSSDALPWMREAAARAATIRGDLQSSVPAAMQRLASWRQDTMTAIGVTAG